MSLQQSLETLRAKVVGLADLGAVLKFDCGADGAVVIDGHVNPPTVEQRSCDNADVNIILSAESFAAIVNGTLNPGIAFVMGKIKVKGDKSPLLKLQKVL